MQRPRIAWRRSPSANGFTLVELIAAVALLIILVGILFVVFGEASRTVSIGQTRLARYAAVRGFFRLLEDDLANAFLMHDENGNWYGLVGANAQDTAFLSPAPAGDSDRLTLIRLRPGQSAANKPGFVEGCYLRRTYPLGQELVVDRRNCLFRAADEDMTGWPPASPGQPFPSGFLSFSVPDPTDSANNAYFQKYIVALDVSDLQFRYLKVTDPNSSGTWQPTWNPATDTYDPDGPGGPLPARPGLPIAVEVTVRLGPDSSTSPADHDVFTQLIRLPIAP